MTGLIATERVRRGVSIRDFARAAGVSPTAVVNWERADRDGVIQVDTLRRALSALGATLVVGIGGGVGVERPRRREERVALSLHRYVAAKVLVDPAPVLDLVPRNIQVMRRHVRGDRVNDILDRWAALATLDRVDELVTAMIDPSGEGVEMRQNSPFAGALSEGERKAAIEAARQ